jgi:hypothetical protein
MGCHSDHCSERMNAESRWFVKARCGVLDPFLVTPAATSGWISPLGAASRSRLSWVL